MQVLIINLPEAKERMSFQQEQMQRLGLDYRRLEAVTTGQLDPPAGDAYWKKWERSLKDTEKAAFMSHKRAWQTVADHNRPYLILEDDALLSNQIQAFTALCESIEWADHVSLEARGRKKIVGRKLVSTDIPLRRLYQDRTGAAAYILWPSGAKKLLERCRNYSGLADAVISSTYNMKSYQCDPALAIQLDMCKTYGLVAPIDTHSFIDEGEYENSRRSTFGFQKVMFKTRRLISQLKMAFHILRHVPVAKRVEILPDAQGLYR